MRRAAALVALVSLLPVAARGEDFRCPAEGRLADAKAPSDFPVRPDARCVTGGLLYFVGPDGTPYPQMTRVSPGWYFTAAGYEQANALFQRRGTERDTMVAKAQAVSAACAKKPDVCGTATTPAVEQPPATDARPVFLAFAVGAGVGLVLGIAGGAYLTVRAMR